MGNCAVESCERVAKSRGWCHAHYQRWRKHGDVKADVPLQGRRPCAVESCDRTSYARGHCTPHYRRMLKHGHPQVDIPIREVGGEGWVNHGYFYIPVDEEERHLTDGATYMAEHRLVMARHLGRALHDDESVHHVNGVKIDNRLENLELWSSSHPSGQRVDDKVEFAVWLLHRYAAHLLSPAASPPPGA